MQNLKKKYLSKITNIIKISRRKKCCRFGVVSSGKKKKEVNEMEKKYVFSTFSFLKL